MALFGDFIGSFLSEIVAMFTLKRFMSPQNQQRRSSGRVETDTTTTNEDAKKSSSAAQSFLVALNKTLTPVLEQVLEDEKYRNLFLAFLNGLSFDQQASLREWIKHDLITPLELKAALDTKNVFDSLQNLERVRDRRGLLEKHFGFIPESSHERREREDMQASIEERRRDIFKQFTSL